MKTKAIIVILFLFGVAKQAKMIKYKYLLISVLVIGFLFSTKCLYAESSGEVIGWGYNAVGGDLTKGYVQVASGCWHSLGLKADGSIVSWGFNYEELCSIPYPNSDFVDIYAGAYHSLGLKSDGSIVAWGYNYKNQCDVPSPNSDFVACDGGIWHSLGLKSDCSIVTWGYDNYGLNNVPLPNKGFIAVAAGGHCSLAIKTECNFTLSGDINNDCEVNFIDIAMLADNWLVGTEQN